MIELLDRCIEVVVGERRRHKAVVGLARASDDILQTKLSGIDLSKANTCCLLLR